MGGFNDLADDFSDIDKKNIIEEKRARKSINYAEHSDREIEKKLKKKTIDGKLNYMVKFKGISEFFADWIPIDEMPIGSNEIVANFEAKCKIHDGKDDDDQHFDENSPTRKDKSPEPFASSDDSDDDVMPEQPPKRKRIKAVVESSSSEEDNDVNKTLSNELTGIFGNGN